MDRNTQSANHLADETVTAAKDRGVTRILIVEDDAPLARFLQRELAQDKYATLLLPHGEEAIQHLAAESFDLVILDLNLPGIDGLELLARIRQVNQMLPVLVLTARKSMDDRVKALDRGADDCLIKPFAYQELIARIGTILRRRTTSAPASSAGSELVVSGEDRRVMRGSRRVDLTPREYSILEYLMQRVGKTVSRMALMQDVWQVPYDPSTNIVDVYMKYLRDKIDHEGEPKLIRTVRGVGYVFGGE